MKKLLICIVIIGFIAFVFFQSNTQQQNSLSKNYIDHDITYIIDSLDSEISKASNLQNILEQLPENVKVSQSSSILTNDDEFAILGLQFDFNEEEEGTKTLLYDVCLFFSIYENLDTINISVNSKDLAIPRSSIEQLLTIELKNTLLETNTTWQNVKTIIQNIDENKLQELVTCSHHLLH